MSSIKDPNLKGNELIEEKIVELYRNMNDENLAEVFGCIRSRKKEGGHFVVAVNSNGEAGFNVRTVKTGDGSRWFVAYTSFDEELKSNDPVMSGFTTGISELFSMALQAEGISGVILNPWDKAIKIEKTMLAIL